jgi:mannose-6-phosphate isomerase-like protein (cupin superfamily)
MRFVKDSEVAPFDWHGITIRDYAGVAPTRSASVAQLRVAPGIAHARGRSRRCDKYYVVLEGSVHFRVGDHDADMRAGDLMFIEKDEWFQYENRGESDATMLLVHIPPFDEKAEELEL